MNKKKLAFSILLISFGIFSVKADIAPDPGYTRISVNLILDVQEDFAEHRFFLQSPIDIEEIILKKGEIKSFDSLNRGGAKRYATLIAIPRDELDRFGITVLLKGDNYINPEWLYKEVQSKKFKGVVELINHSFQKTIPLSEKTNSQNSVYRLERDEVKGIKAMHIQPADGVSYEMYPLYNNTPLLIMGGGFISAAVIFLGIWFFRKKRQNLA